MLFLEHKESAKRIFESAGKLIAWRQQFFDADPRCYLA
ncbi:hypothetical protein PPEP_a0716 [Pseudoalteromonas peptidolytica F12-50-A1]|uniref:Uncharacterized protein n=1 Tax=Pseudoalteromonas peptidolytica F12-50-A1 TaxID=1315280 RepID=A0A8I0T3B3_9GAMM|nr:hypothetical protein [Pseudoalteromonas peptidolytica F12-50-A1]